MVCCEYGEAIAKAFGLDAATHHRMERLLT
jgi:hypothetical protein